MRDSDSDRLAHKRYLAREAHNRVIAEKLRADRSIGELMDNGRRLFYRIDGDKMTRFLIDETGTEYMVPDR